MKKALLIAAALALFSVPAVAQYSGSGQQSGGPAVNRNVPGGQGGMVAPGGDSSGMMAPRRGSKMMMRSKRGKMMKRGRMSKKMMMRQRRMNRM